MAKYKLRSMVVGNTKVGDCTFVDGEFETDNKDIMAFLDGVRHVRKVKTKKKNTEVNSNG